jgi:hypothetical protein
VRRGALALCLALACSAPLEGEVVSQPVADWSFLAEAGDVARHGERTALPHRAGEALRPWGPSTSRSPRSSPRPALDELRAGAELRPAREGVAPLRAIELTTGAEIDPILPTSCARPPRSSRLRWDPEPARYPGPRSGSGSSG